MVGDNQIQNSVASLDGHNTSSPPLVSYLMSASGSGATMLNKSGQGEDLYTWMAKQGFEDADTKMTESKVAKSTFWVSLRDYEPPCMREGAKQNVSCFRIYLKRKRLLLALGKIIHY